MIKIIEDKDFYHLQLLYKDMQTIYTGEEVRNSISAINLCKELSKPNKLVLGAYLQDKLVGFILGYIENDIMYFTNIYCPYKKLTFRLVKRAEEIAMEIGCIRWEATAITEDGKRLLEHLGETDG